MAARESSADIRRHFIQELGLDVEPGQDSWSAEALIRPGAWSPGTCFPRTSVLATYADIIGGAHVRALTLPSLSVTVDIALDVLVDDVATLVVEEVSATSRLLRRGKRLFATESVFRAGSRPIAVATASFSAISRTLNAFGDSPPERRSRFDRQLLAMPLTERVGLEVLGPGAAQLARRPDLGNSTDSLMGGLTILLGECAALSEADAASGRQHFAERLLVRYLAPVRVGPARAQVTLTGNGPRARLSRVEIRDLAQPDQLSADLTVSSVPIDTLGSSAFEPPR